jgi:hypothetical protein
MIRHPRSEAEMAALRVQWDATREVLTHCLAQHAPLFEAVRVRVQPLWEALTAGKPFPRKPPYLPAPPRRRWPNVGWYLAALYPAGAYGRLRPTAR